MFGRRSKEGDTRAPAAPQVVAVAAPPPSAVSQPQQRRPEPVAEPPQRRHSEEYYDVKTTVFNALIDTIDLTQLAKLESAAAREEIRDIVSEIIHI